MRDQTSCYLLPFSSFLVLFPRKFILFSSSKFILFSSSKAPAASNRSFLDSLSQHPPCLPLSCWCWESRRQPMEGLIPKLKQASLLWLHGLLDACCLHRVVIYCLRFFSLHAHVFTHSGTYMYQCLIMFSWPCFNLRAFDSSDSTFN